MASEKNGKGKTPEGGFFNSIFRPLKKHRVTLTRVGKSLAPLRKSKTGTKSAKKTKKAKGKARTKKKEITLLSRHDRQVNELKTLANIGRRDPERLAAIITRMLMDEAEMKQRERRKFERMVLKRAEKYGQHSDEPSGAKEGEQGPVA